MLNYRNISFKRKYKNIKTFDEKTKILIIYEISEILEKSVILFKTHVFEKMWKI